MFLEAGVALSDQRWKSRSEFVKSILEKMMHFCRALLVQLPMWSDTVDSRTRT